ncbi:flagellar motor switch protein FliM [Enterovirga sp. GCM10030262]|uniref:flagellar motor switch protein FliM n=1 Tax=Enterovirga sp. GCM10030262 TaxID=3273391 RepID=UPI0036233142
MTDTSSSLSGEEVDALMTQLGEQNADDPRSATPKAHALGSVSLRPMAALPALERMGERMARKLRDLIEPFARAKPKVTADVVAIRRFESWRAEQPEFMSLSLYSLRPLKGGVLIAIEPAFVSRLVDIFYGGSGAQAPGKAKEFTATEDRLLARLTEALVATLAEVWAEILPVKPRLNSRETNTAFASLVRDEEQVAVARFTIAPSQGRAATIDILYPVASLRAVEAQLSANMNDDGGIASREWRERLASALSEVRLQARSVLARPNLSVAELLELKPGDVIPISVPALVPLLVAGRPVALGRIGDQDGRAALQIEKIEGSSRHE